MYLSQPIYTIMPLVYAAIATVGMFHSESWYGMTLGVILLSISVWIVKARLDNKVRLIETGKRR